jgi:cobalamin biosynthesis protein CobW
LPQPLVRAFNWPEISTRVTVDSVVTVVDGKAVNDGQFAHDTAAVDAQRAMDDNLDHETPLSELFEDQIACADMIVINKTDLLDATQTDNLSDRLTRDSRAGVQVVKTSMGVLPVDVLLGRGQAAEDDISARHELHHHHHDDADDDHHDHEHEHGHDEFESFVVTRPEIIDAAGFARQVADTIRAHDILRLKGFAAVAGKPMRLTLQAVGPRIDTYFDRPLAVGEPRETRLVVIGQTGLDRAAITAALTA